MKEEFQANKKTTTSFKSTEDLARSLGFTKAEAEIITMKGTVIGQLDKERERRGYFLTLAAKCGTLFKLTMKAA